MPLIRLLRMLGFLLGALVLALLVQLTNGAWQELRRTNEALRATEQFRLALVAMEMASRERGPTNGVLGEDLPHSADNRQNLQEARRRTDVALAALQARLGSGDARRGGELWTARASLAHARETVDALVARPLSERSSEAISAAVQDMVVVVRQLGPLIGDLAAQAQTSYPPIGDELQAARLVAELREYAGLLGSHFTAALAGGRPLTRAELDAVQRTRGRIDELRFLVDLRLHQAQDSEVATQVWQRAQARYFGKSLLLAEQVIARSDAGRPDGLDPAAFARAYVPDMNSLLEVRDALIDETLGGARAAQRNGYLTLGAVLVGVVITIGLLTALVLVVRRRVLQPLVAVARAVDDLADNSKPLAPLPRVVAADEMAAVVGAIRALQERTQQRIALEKERDTLIEQLRSQSNTDALTGLLNRRGLFEAAEHLFGQARRYGFEVAILLLDVDHFKRFNDEFGHAVGDEALVIVADILRRTMRDSDLAGRLGGEEFALLLGHCDMVQGHQLAERIRLALDQIPPRASTRPGAPPLPMTASFGVAGFPAHGTALEPLLSCADKAMYEAKMAGRNRVVVASRAAA